MDFEAALREACIEADKTYWETFFERMDSMPDIIISEDKDNRLREFIRNYKIASELKKKNRKGMTRGIKALLIAAIILLIVAFTAFAFEPVKNFVFKVYSDCTEFVFQSGEKSEGDYLYAEYTYIPDGYELVKDHKGKTSHNLVYSDGTNEIEIWTRGDKNTTVLIDTEEAKTGELMIGNNVGFYSIARRSIILVWSTGKYHHDITADINENISLDDIVRVAQSAVSIS